MARDAIGDRSRAGRKTPGLWSGQMAVAAVSGTGAVGFNLALGARVLAAAARTGSTAQTATWAVASGVTTIAALLAALLGVLIAVAAATDYPSAEPTRSLASNWVDHFRLALGGGPGLRLSVAKGAVAREPSRGLPVTAWVSYQDPFVEAAPGRRWQLTLAGEVRQSE